MAGLETLRTAFIAFLDGLWWGLRDNVGALSMYEGYSRGFRQVGLEIAEGHDGSGPEAAAQLAASVFEAIGMEVQVNGGELTVTRCPLWDRVLERGLEYAFHVEETCWRPLLEAIAEKTGTTAVVESSLRLAHIAGAKAEYKRRKAKAALEKGTITREEYEAQLAAIDRALSEVVPHGQYRFQ